MQAQNLAKHPARIALDAEWKVFDRRSWMMLEEMHLLEPPDTVHEFVTPRLANIALIETFSLERYRADMRVNTKYSWANYVDTYLTFATWRLSQGVYRFDVDIYSAVIDTPLEGEIPSEILKGLPERCVFIETPTLRFSQANGDSVPIYGIWVRLEHVDSGQMVIVMHPLLACGESFEVTPPVRIPVAESGANWEENVARAYLSDSNGLPDVYKIDIVLRNVGELFKAWLTPALNLVLFLCSDSSEFAGGVRPNVYIPPTKTRKWGARFFPADIPKKWDVIASVDAIVR
jgi:hypothetical protein